ncbi:hypothetical protein ACFE04_007365 [Oxalis oulophora]
MTDQITHSVSLAAAAAIKSPSNPRHNSTRFTRPLSLTSFTIVAVISHLRFHAASPLQPSVTTSTGVDTSLIGELAVRDTGSGDSVALRDGSGENSSVWDMMASDRSEETKKHDGSEKSSNHNPN